MVKTLCKVWLGLSKCLKLSNYYLTQNDVIYVEPNNAKLNKHPNCQNNG
jgi:hypothetical protein